MRSASVRAGRKAWAVASILCVLVASSLPLPASAASPVNPPAVAASRIDAGALPLRIGAVAQRLFDAASTAGWPSAEAALTTLRAQVCEFDGNFAARLQVDALVLEARRMRTALVRGDTEGYESAHHEFGRLSVELHEMPGMDPAKVDALDRALTLAALTRNAQVAIELQRAAQDVVESSGPSIARAP